MRRRFTSPDGRESIRRGLLPEYLLPTDLAIALGLADADAARRFVRREGVPHVVLGKRLYVRRRALDDWLAARETPAATPPPEGHIR
jgi:hypothetical protein